MEEEVTGKLKTRSSRTWVMPSRKPGDIRSFERMDEQCMDKEPTQARSPEPDIVEALDQIGASFGFGFAKQKDDISSNDEWIIENVEEDHENVGFNDVPNLNGDDKYFDEGQAPDEEQEDDILFIPF
ncbi:unnamed protein product [Sphenostylis stenocarpa]|uniref:Uncharacterized protein n=1 Tax=Sphenostylis stenocarpa TaxID=92480 RepID=A0AA86SDF1_9FABA|nr:unnamed protein product [Sphenostylis stenocarpa]